MFGKIATITWLAILTLCGLFSFYLWFSGNPHAAFFVAGLGFAALVIPLAWGGLSK